MEPDWIALEWGLTRTRAWALQGEAVLDRYDTDAPARGLPALPEDWLPPGGVDVLACGPLAGQSAVPVPAPPVSAPVPAESDKARLRMRLVPGLSQRQPPDLIHGAALRIAGFLSLNRNWDGVLCLPGLHTVWAQVSADEVVSFRSFLSGEIAAGLRAGSLAQATAGPWQEDRFTEAVDQTLSRPETLAARLSDLRAAHCLNADTGGAAALSGALIGAELAAARPYWLGQQVAVIGPAEDAGRYAAALAHTGVPATLARDEPMVLAGFRAARALI